MNPELDIFWNDNTTINIIEDVLLHLQLFFVIPEKFLANYLNFLFF